MADRTELDNLVYGMSVDLNTLSRDVKKALDVVKAGSRDTERVFDEAGKKAGKAMGKGLADETGKAAALNRNQMMELAHVARSVADGLAAGQNPIRLMAMEGGRLAEVFGMGSGGVGGAMSALPALLNPVTIGIAAVTVVLAGAVAAELAYEEAHRKLLVALLGTAAASGFTVKSLNDIAEAAGRADKVSVAMARDAAVTFASLGHVTQENMGQALGVLRDYAVLTGQKVPEASKELAKAFADPAKGAEELNNKLYFLSTEQIENIRHMTEQGDRAGALKELLTDLRGATDGAASHMNGLTKALEDVGKAFSDAWDKAGGFFYELQHGHDIGDIEGLKRELATYQALLKQHPGSTFLQEQVKSIQDEIKANDPARQKQAAANLRDAQLAETAKELDPQQFAIDDVKAKVKALTDEQERRRRGEAPQTTLTDEQLRRSVAEGNRQVLRLQHREDRVPRAPADRGAGTDDAAQKALDRARLAVTTDIVEKANLEKQAIDDELKSQLDSLASKKIKNQADRDAAKAAYEQAATLQKQAIDQRAAQELARQRAENQREIDQLGDEYLRIMAGVVETSKQRQDIERQLLANRQREEREDLERQIAQPNFSGDAGALRAGLDQKQKAERKAQAQSQEGPLRQWVDANSAAAKDVGLAYQRYAVEGIDGFNSALADSVANAQNFGQAVISVFRRILAQWIQMQLQMQEAKLFKILGFGGGNSDAFTVKPQADDGGYTPMPQLAARAGGGPMMPGVDYLINEGRPEVFRPDVPGRMFTSVNAARNAPDLTAGGSVRSGDVHLHMSLAGANGEEAIRGIVEEGVRTAINHADRSIEAYDRKLYVHIARVNKRGR